MCSRIDYSAMSLSLLNALVPRALQVAPLPDEHSCIDLSRCLGLITGEGGKPTEGAALKNRAHLTQILFWFGLNWSDETFPSLSLHQPSGNKTSEPSEASPGPHSLRSQSCILCRNQQGATRLSNVNAADNSATSTPA